MGYFSRQIAFYLTALWLSISFTYFLPAVLGPVPFRQGEGSGDYLTYLWNIVHLNLGTSPYPPFSPVTEQIAGALPWTLILVGGSLLLGATSGTVLGMVAAWRRGSAFDSVVTTASVFCSALPFYYFGLAMLFLVGVVLRWAPLGNEYSAPATLSWAFAGDVLGHAVLPVLTLTLATVGNWLLLMRNAMVGTLGEEYILLGQAKGLRARTVALRYAARNALLPVLTNAGIQLGYMLGGVVIAERVFSYPGVGYLLLQAVGEHDFPVIQALIALSAAVTLTANLIASLLYARLDPRVVAV